MMTRMLGLFAANPELAIRNEPTKSSKGNAPLRLNMFSSFKVDVHFFDQLPVQMVGKNALETAWKFG